MDLQSLSTPPPSEELDAVDRELERELNGLRRDGSHAAVPRGPVRSALLGWCTRAAGRLMCRNSAGQMTVTMWGGRMLRTLFLVLVEDHALWSPGLCDWLDEHIVPCLFPLPDSRERTHESLSYELLHSLLQTMRARCVATEAAAS